VPDADAAESIAVGTLLRELQIVPVRATRLVNIRFRTRDAALAAEVANAHAEQYIEQNLELRAQTSRAAGDWLTARLEEERRRVEETESVLQRFREEHDAVSLEDGQNIVVQKLADLNAAVTKAKTKRLEAEAQYRQVAALQADTLYSFPAVLGNELIQRLKVDLASLQREYAQLSETLGDRHPRIVEKGRAIQITEARIQHEIGTVVQSLRRAFESAVAEENSLTEALEAQKREALAQNRQGIEYGVLKREAESTREVYMSLLQRAKETGVSRELRASNIRIVDPAEPPRAPSSPNNRRNLLLGLLAGLVLAVGAVFGLEVLDERIKAPEDMNTYLGIALLGLVPKVRRTSASVYVNGDVQPAVEAFRALRSLLFYPADGSPPVRSLLVTSTNRGEGKTVVATNLAIALARNQWRVLLIDADMRDPGVHELFSEPLEPGLSTVLRGEASLDAARRPTKTPGLELLPGGRHPSNPTELLGSPAFEQLLAAAYGVFDYVIIDSPPVMAVADAVVAAHVAGSTLFVVGADMTTRGAARLAVHQLHSVGARILGGVLNNVDLRRHPYYYAPYYRPGYEPVPPRAGRSPLSIT
jgi:capsular exopolysaccharide synthesis family protein